jgi:Bacterial Ig-like domain/Fibronectin type III domain
MKKLLIGFLLATLLACNPTPPPPPADTTPPATPNGFKVTASNAAVKLVWTANTESDLEQYTLRWGSSAAQQNASETIAKTQTSFDLTGLTNGTQYYFKLEASDKTGNTSSSTNLLSATPIAPDTTAPTLTSSVPALNASAVPLNTQVQLTFSKVMNISTVTASSNNLTLGTSTWSAGNTVVSFVTPALQNQTTYTILIAGKDLAGNNLGGATTLQFSSLPAAPTVTSNLPTNNATDVPINSQISLHFSKPMNKTSLETAFSSLPSIACTWVWTDSDQTATCTPSANLAFLTKYDLSVSSSAQSAAGVGLSSAFTGQFTTVQDTVKPALVDFTPLDAATSVLYKTAIVLNFSEAMNQTSVQNEFQSQPAITCNWTWTTPSSASCQPAQRLNEFTQYQITLGISATDLAGNPMQAAYGFNFTVGKAPPKIISVTPANSATNLPTNTPIVVTFNGVIVKETAEAALQVKVGTTVKTGGFTWNPECLSVGGLLYVGCKQMTFTPSSPYPVNSVVVWSVGTGVTDFTNLTMENEVTGSFRTTPRGGP